MRAILLILALLAPGAALAQQPLPGGAPPFAQRPAPFPAPPPDLREAPAAAPRVWLSTSQTGGDRAAVGVWSPAGLVLIAPRDGDYWLIVEGWPRTGAALTARVGEHTMRAELPPCPETCGRDAPLGVGLAAGERVRVRIAGYLEPRAEPDLLVPLT